MKFSLFLIIILILLFIGPIIVALSGQVDFGADYRTANRDSAGLAPDPAENKEAVVEAYVARGVWGA